MRITEITHIAEARKRSDVNLTIPVNAYINKYFREVEQSGDSVGNSVVLNLFVSLTAIPKLGINPRSHYNTPLGVYAYPAEYVVQKVGRKLPLDKLPFAGEEPWANIFRVKDDSNIIDLDEVTEEMYDQYCQRFAEILNKRFTSSIETTNKVIARFKEEANSAARVKTAGGKLWYVSMETSKQLTGLYREKSNSITWNKLFRDVGIDGFVDMGKGIIHPSEPTQAVFFSMRPIEILDRVQNKYSPDTQEKQRLKGQAKKGEFEVFIKEFRKILATGDVQEIIKWLATNKGIFINYVPAALRAEIIKRRPANLLALNKIRKSDYYAALVGSPWDVLVNFKLMYGGTLHETNRWTKFLTPQELAQALFQAKKESTRSVGSHVIEECFRYIYLEANKSGIDLTTPANSVVLKALINLNPGVFKSMLGIYAYEGKILDKDIYEYALTVADEKEKDEIIKRWNYFNKQYSDIEDMITQYNQVKS